MFHISGLSQGRPYAVGRRVIKISPSGELMGEPSLEPDEDEPDQYGREEFELKVEDGDTDSILPSLSIVYTRNLTLLEGGNNH